MKNQNISHFTIDEDLAVHLSYLLKFENKHKLT